MWEGGACESRGGAHMLAANRARAGRRAAEPRRKPSELRLLPLCVRTGAGNGAAPAEGSAAARDAWGCNSTPPRRVRMRMPRWRPLWAPARLTVGTGSTGPAQGSGCRVRARARKNGVCARPLEAWLYLTINPITSLSVQNMTFHYTLCSCALYAAK